MATNLSENTSLIETPIILSVSQITWTIKNQLEQLFPNIWVKGEVSNFKKQASGHLYFSLNDEGAQIAAVMFRGNASSLPMPINNGDTIIVKGDLNVYPPRGNYQIVVKSITYAGLGEQLLKLQQLKKKLEALGWTSPDRKRPLPTSIERIVVVTSPTGAVLRDICQILNRRMAGFRLIVNPVRVQGELASKEIAQAIRECSQYRLGDVLILCRGGGSAEDLSPFNDEDVAKAIVECSIPVVSAVGHETDFTIADLVADVRAPTPSAAAELVSHEKQELVDRLKMLRKGIYKAYTGKLSHLKELTSKLLNNKNLKGLPSTIMNRAQRFDELQENLLTITQLRIRMKKKQLDQATKFVQSLAPQTRLIQQREKLNRLNLSLSTRIQSILFQTKNQLKAKERQLIALNPFNVLERGYAVVRRKKDKSVVSSIQTLNVHEQVELVLKDGSALADVTEVLKK